MYRTVGILAKTIFFLVLFSYCTNNSSEKRTKEPIANQNISSDENYLEKLDSIQKLISEKNQELTLIQERINNNNKKIKVKKTNNSLKTGEKDNLLDEINQLNIALTKLESGKKDFQHKIEKIEFKVDSLSDLYNNTLKRNVKLDDELKFLHSSKNKYELDIINLQSEKNDLTLELERNKNLLTENSLQIEEYKAKSDIISAKMSAVETDKKKLKKELNEVKSILEEKNTELNSNEKNSDNVERELFIITEKNEEINFQLNKAIYKIDSLQSELNIQTCKLDLLKKENQEILKSINNAEGQYLKTDIQQKETESNDSILFLIESLNTDLKNLKLEKNKIAEQLNGSNNQANKLSEIVKKNNAEKENLAKEIKELKQYKTIVEKELEKNKQERTNLNNQLTASNNALTRSKKQEEEYKNLAEQYASKNATFEIDKQRLEEELKTVKNQLNKNSILISENEKSQKVTKISLNELKRSSTQQKDILNKSDLKIDSLNRILLSENKKLKFLQYENEQLLNKLNSEKTAQKYFEEKIDSLNKLVARTSSKKINENNKAENNINVELEQQIEGLNSALVLSNRRFDSTKILLNEKDISLTNFETLSESQNSIAIKYERESDSLARELDRLLTINDSLLKSKHIFNEPDSVIELDTITEEATIDFTQPEYFPLYNSRKKVKISNKQEISAYLQRYCENYLSKKSSLELLELKEFFIFYLDTLGNVVSISDERTAINNNTKLLKTKNLDSLKLFRFNPVIINGKKIDVVASIGVFINVAQTKYDYKVQKDKLRVYKTPMYVEYVEESDKHFSMINTALKDYKRVTDRFNITILDGSYKIVEYSKKEYNPFAKEKSLLLENDILKITKIRGIR